MKKVIYSYIGNDSRRYIVEHLDKECDWRPVLFHGTEDVFQLVKDHYPNAIPADSTKLRNGYFNYSDIGEVKPLDAKIINKLSEHESNCLSWLQDTTGWNFSYQERRRYYYDILKYWNTVINNLKPDIFIAYTWPHLPSDYPLYLLCKHYYSIPVLFLDIVPHFDQHYHTVACSLENLSEQFVQYYRSDASRQTSEVVKNYLTKLRSDNPGKPGHIAKYYDHLDKLKAGNYKNYIQMFKYLLSGRALKISGATFKKNQAPWGSEKSQLTFLDSFIFKEKIRRNNKALKSFYEGFATKPSYDEKYIYFAAPYQPESISNIAPGVYEDPFLVLDILSNVIPDDWKVYYKEHPNTFHEMDRGSLSRSKSYYNDLRNNRKIMFIPTSTDTFTLIDNSEAVATAGGTVGWEAVVRGKPALVFGSLWYQECKSVFTIAAYQDAVNAISKVREGYVPDSKDVERYAQSIFLASNKDLVTMTGYAELIKKRSDPQNEMIRIANAFIKAYRRLYGTHFSQIETSYNHMNHADTTIK